MNFYNLDIRSTLDQLKTDPLKGLTKDEASIRQSIHQKNIFYYHYTDHLWTNMIEHIKEPLVIVLMLSSLISFILGNYIFGFGMFITLMASIGISAFQENRSEKLFDFVKNQDIDSTIRVVREGECFYIPKEEITVGDICYLEAGEKVPADGRLIDHENFLVDESLFTKDRTPVEKTTTTISNQDICANDQHNMVFAGTLVLEGKGLIAITAIGEDTHRAKNVNFLHKPTYKFARLENQFASLIKKITILAMFTAEFFLFLQFLKNLQGSGYVSTKDFFIDTKNIFVFSIALIYACVPEGISGISKYIFAFSINKMYKMKILIRPSINFENLCKTNVICLDKVGIVTKKEHEITDVWENGDFIDTNNLKNDAVLKNICLHQGCDIPSEECDINEVLLNLAKINDYDQNHNKEYQDIRAEFTKTDEQNKDSIVFFKDKLYSIFAKGDYKQIIEICSKIYYNNEIIDFSDEMKSSISRKIQKLENEGKYIIAFAHQKESKARLWSDRDDVEKDLIFDSFIALKQNINDDLLDTVTTLDKAKIDLKIFTTDNLDQAFFLANNLGLSFNENLVLDANSIEEYSDAELSQILPQTVIIANSSYEIKKRVIKLLRLLGHTVLAGNLDIKDTPSLEACNVSIAMNNYSCDYVKESSDIVLQENKISNLTEAIKLARGTYKNLQRFIQFQLTLSISLLLIVILSLVLNLITPFTPIGLLLINIILSGILALFFAFEPPDESILFEDSKYKRFNLCSKSMYFKIFSNTLFIILGMVLLLFISPRDHIGALQIFNNNLTNYIPTAKSIVQNISVFFVSFIMFNLWNAFNSKELNNEFIIKKIHKNKAMLLSMFTIVVLQVILVQFTGRFFSFSPISYELWISIVTYTFSIILFDQILKLPLLSIDFLSNKLKKTKAEDEI